MKVLYCWKCREEKPLLEEEEWAVMEELLRIGLEATKRYREEHGSSLADTPISPTYREAVIEYRKMTGFHEADPDVIWHHRLSDYGPPCKNCGKPLRSSSARRCFECEG